MKAPNKIIIEIDRENHYTAKVSFGDIRKREILYDIYEIGEEQTSDKKHIQIVKMKMMRIHDFKKEYAAHENKKLKDNEHIIFTRKNVKNKETPTICELHQSAGKSIYKPKDTLRPAGIKDTLRVGYKVKGLDNIRLANYNCPKSDCQVCGLDTHSHPQIVVGKNSTTSLCIMDWIKEGNPPPRERDMITVDKKGIIIERR